MPRGQYVFNGLLANAVPELVLVPGSAVFARLVTSGTLAQDTAGGVVEPSAEAHGSTGTAGGD